ncbi:MAG TPA: amino acid-binding protein, partial [Patescibacteria group bacterium]|nr:amino acid-binding protein [Patescibacteria group bacterium]
MVENGLTVRNCKIYLNQIEIPPVRVARVAGVDRRTVKETLNVINSNRELRGIFEDLRSAGYSLKEIAKHLDFGVVEITPVDAKTPGILANSAKVLADSGISIRQAI